MATSFAINGFGRVGRALARVVRARDDLRWAAVNDLGAASDLAELLRRDSLRGRYAGDVRVVSDHLEVDGERVVVSRQADPARVPWEAADVRVVVETSGAAVDRSTASGHLRGGVTKVLIGAISPDADLVLCRGVNDDAYDPTRHHLVSAASCTTHCLALVLKVLEREFGVRSALMSEVHGYTTDQRLLDAVHPRDARRGRAAALNIVPTYSAAPAAAAQLLGLEGRIAGSAVRVPTPAVALLDVVATLRAEPTTAMVRAAFEAAAGRDLAGLLDTCDGPLVSSDFVGDPASAVVDLPSIQRVGELVRIQAWYDNEWGYAHRLAELVARLGEEAT
ncbi:MAG: glyceraldehyde 3-phosphate dehydrogenase NAD-binding domain-containing protein [Acidobacteriota bacterium]